MKKRLDKAPWIVYTLSMVGGFVPPNQFGPLVVGFCQALAVLLGGLCLLGGLTLPPPSDTILMLANGSSFLSGNRRPNQPQTCWPAFKILQKVLDIGSCLLYYLECRRWMGHSATPVASPAASSLLSESENP
jgi:hypothetical protein